ncbi:hypothetical protein AAG570_003121, partial [Ranatra chinensis]
EPLWERQCETCEVTIHELFELLKACENEKPDSWYYFDYKHVSEWFNNADALNDLSWEFMGLSGKTGKDSTIWIGSKRSHTSCHMDTYGYNVVAQLYGRKRWILFPPEETDHLKPSRVPYEESSIYSRINFSCGCSTIEGTSEIRMVILEPGDILYVPKNWWHYVENLSTAISINIWMPVASDDISRLEESLAKCFLIAITSGLNSENRLRLLNPNEVCLNNLPTIINTSELTWCLNKCLRRNEQNVSKKEDILDSDNICEVPKITLEKLLEVLRRNCLKSTSLKLDENAEKTVDIVDLIDAFCHPDVLALVRSKLCSSLK